MASTAATTFRLADLPAELRIQVWASALLNEAQQRIAMLTHDKLGHGITTITISKHLISSLMLTSGESRYEAKSFYSFAIPVVKRRSHGSHRLAATDADTRTGTIYVSLEHDTFLVGGLCCRTYAFGSTHWVHLTGLAIPFIAREPDEGKKAFAKRACVLLACIRKACIIAEPCRILDLEHTSSSGRISSAVYGYAEFGLLRDSRALNERDQRALPFVRDRFTAQLARHLYHKGRAGIETFLQLCNREASFARLGPLCNARPNHNHTYPQGAAYELISLSEPTKIMDPRDDVE